MSDSPSRPGKSDRAAVPQTITARVLARVSDAGLVVDRRTKATRPKATRRRSAAPDLLSASVTRTPAQVREARALRRVFLDLGDSYREYRQRTGAPVSSDVRDAAYRFRRELNVTSLVSVAASLDQLDVLTW
jgi:hypothetical protein